MHENVELILTCNFNYIESTFRLIIASTKIRYQQSTAKYLLVVDRMSLKCLKEFLMDYFAYMPIDLS